MGSLGAACALKRRHRRAILEKYKTSDEDLTAHFQTLNLGRYQFFKTFGQPSLSSVFLLRLLLSFTDSTTCPKRVVKARLFGKRAPRAPIKETLPLTVLQLPKATAEQSSSDEEIQFEFANPTTLNFT
jgi:hypothetical protein